MQHEDPGAAPALIDAAALAALIGTADLAVIDCRYDLTDAGAGRAAFLRAHLPGARYADLGLDLSAPVAPGTGRHPLPDPLRMAARLGELGVDERTHLVAYDAGNGAYAARLWWLARWLGAARVSVLNGGFAAWVGSAAAVASGAAHEGPPAAPRRFTPRIREGAWLTSGEVVEALRDPARLVVDARAPERFAGTVEPLDPVAGHVPGAVNHPFTRNLDATGRFLPRDELRRLWLGSLSGVAPGNSIAMCGSGVTACHNLLAMHLAGLDGAKLYAGSWSEWIQDPARGVATG